MRPSCHSERSTSCHSERSAPCHSERSAPCHSERSEGISSPKLTIRPATPADLPALRPVFEAAKAIMRADGNLEQWSAPGFPDDTLLLRDIARGGGYVILRDEISPRASLGRDDKDTAPDDGHAVIQSNGSSVIQSSGSSVISSGAVGGVEKSIVGYFALLPSPEPTYNVIDGAWLTDEPYGVIHRMASYPDVHGIFSAVIDFAAARYAHLRIDTHRDNRIMQHLIRKHGFTYCGIIWLQDGTERLAYER